MEIVETIVGNFSYIIFLAHQLFDNDDIFENVKIMFIVVCLH